ncbi:hypothetical protein DIPPA_07050 [Diplonema papillatum]|nr:hypothetical protein DIPPA_07050 [Diplonema papillatum]
MRPTQTKAEAPWQWVPAKKSKQHAELRSEDWDVPVVDVQALQGCIAGVAIASRAETKKAYGGGVRKGACAMVVLGAVPELAGLKGHTSPVVIRRGTRVETTTGTLFQLGEKPVSSKLTMREAPMPDAREWDDTHRLSVHVPRQYTTPGEWEEATSNLRAYLQRFAGEAGVDGRAIGITGVETRGRAEDPARSIGALLRVTGEQAKTLEAASGHRGVFVRDKKDAGPIVWLAANTTLPEARELARRLQARRLAANRRGLGLRVAPEAEERVRTAVGEKAVPKRNGMPWDVYGFAKRTTAAQAEAFLRTAGWEGVTAIKVIPKRGRVLAVVRGTEPPSWVFGVTGGGTRIEVSSARPISETEQRWVQAAAPEKRRDPAEVGSVREQERYTWAEFLSCYGKRKGIERWREAGKQLPEGGSAAKGLSGGKKGSPMKGGKGGKDFNIESATGPAGPKPAGTPEATEMEELRAQLKEALRQIEDLTKRLAEVQTKQAGAQKSPSPRRQPSADREEGKTKKTKGTKPGGQKTGAKKRARSGTESASQERNEAKPPAKMQNSAASMTKKSDRQSTLAGFVSSTAK